MLTNNFYTTVKNEMSRTNSALINILGNRVTNVAATYWYTTNSFNTGNYHWQIQLGNGLTPASIDDYAIESPITDLTLLAGTATSPDSNKILKAINATYQNNTKENITVTEVCLLGYYNSAEFVFLFNREVLAEPVIIAPGEAHSFTCILSTDNL